MGRNPFEEFEEMLERMSEQVERGMIEGGGLPVSHSAPVDVTETEDAFVVTVDLPGYETVDVDLTYADGSLRLEATRELTTESGEEGRFVRRERHTESVSRRIGIPGDVDEEAIEASHSNGVLTVTLPKAAPAEGSHSIDID